MQQYLDLVQKVLKKGTRKENRTGIDALSAFNCNYEIDLRDGFPLLTTKTISWKNIVIENLWFLSGTPHIGLLKRHDCKFWDAWANPQGMVPSAYGSFWRQFPAHGTAHIDQIKWVLEELRKNPWSRRLVISAWAPENAHNSSLPPCHCMFILNVQNHPELGPRLCLHLTQRSADVALGVPYNIAGYALILELFARFSGLSAGIFAHSLVDAHVYTAKPDGQGAAFDHVPGLKQQLLRTPRRLPTLKIDPSIRSLDDLKPLLEADTETVLQAFRLEGYDPHPPIHFQVAV